MNSRMFSFLIRQLTIFEYKWKLNRWKWMNWLCCRGGRPVRRLLSICFAFYTVPRDAIVPVHASHGGGSTSDSMMSWPSVSTGEWIPDVCTYSHDSRWKFIAPTWNFQTSVVDSGEVRRNWRGANLQTAIDSMCDILCGLLCFIAPLIARSWSIPVKVLLNKLRSPVLALLKAA